MSQENVEVVRDMTTRFATGDRESWREVLAEDVIWDTSATTLPQASVYEGHSEVERTFIDWLGTWEDLAFENLDFIDAGDSGRGLSLVRSGQSKRRRDRGDCSASTT